MDSATGGRYLEQFFSISLHCVNVMYSLEEQVKIITLVHENVCLSQVIKISRV